MAIKMNSLKNCIDSVSICVGHTLESRSNDGYTTSWEPNTLYIGEYGYKSAQLVGRGEGGKGGDGGAPP